MASDDRSTNAREHGVEADGDPDAPLRAYRLARESVVQFLRDLQRFMDGSAPWASGRIRDLMIRLGEDRFQLVVLGQFKRGKTSLINAIVGSPLLPTGAVPVTSAVVSLRYGPILRACIRRAGRAFNEEVPIEDLPAFITERGNPGNRKRVLGAEIDVPAPFLRRGLYLVDTPGIGSAHEHNTAATLAFLPQADAAVFVTGADAPLSEVELGFLDAVRTHVRKLFFVLNKVDQLDADEQAELEAYTTRLLCARLGLETVRVFPVSATRALAAKGEDDETGAASGIPAFEHALTTFLNDERRLVFLVALLDRAIGTLKETRFMLDLRRRAREPSGPTAQDAVVELGHQFDSLESDRAAALDRARQRIANWQATVLDPALSRFAAENSRTLRADLPGVLSESSAKARHVSRLGHEWARTQLERRASNWVADCAAPIDTVERAIVAEFRPAVETVARRVRSLASTVLGGTAQPPHDEGDEPGVRWAWTPPAFEAPGAGRRLDCDWAEPPSARLPLSRAWARHLAIRAVERALPHDVGRAAAVARQFVLGYLVVDRMDALLSRGEGCPACHAQREAEQVASARLARGLAAPEALAAFERSAWLCLRHLRPILATVGNEVSGRLLRAHARRLAELSESMREYALKLDAARRSLLTEEEMSAYRRTLVMLVGEKYLFRTDPEE